MPITFKKDGYGQVEPNHLSAPRDGGVYAQLPAASGIDVLENGMFVKYNYADGECKFTGDGAWMLVFNEEKLYDERYQMHKHYAQKVAESYDGKIYPRVFRMSLGDLYTTNMFADGEVLEVGDIVAPGNDGILTIQDPENLPAGLALQVVKEYSMPDGQDGVKLQVIAE